MDEKELLRQILAVSVLNLKALQALIAQQPKSPPVTQGNQDQRFYDWVEASTKAVLDGLEQARKAANQ